MHVFRNLRWSALAITFGLALPMARAEMITPDSIPNPPSAVASAQGTPVYPSNSVTTQYKGLGLNFSGAAITNVNGMSVWAPAEGIALPGSSSTAVPPGINPVAEISYSGMLKGSFVSPGSLNATTVSSLAVQIVGNPSLSMHVYGINGQILNTPVDFGSIGNTRLWMFTGPGIGSFSATAVPPPSPVGAQPAAATSPWGIAGISFTPAASTPEPTSLALAGLGALGLATRLGWRRFRRVARPIEA